MNDNNQPATKADLKNLGDSIVDSVGEALNDLTDMIAKRFDKVDARFEKVDERFEQVDERFNRLELKVTNVTDNHEVRISKLETQHS